MFWVDYDVCLLVFTGLLSMQVIQAIEFCALLSNEKRFQIVCKLVEAGDEGLMVKELANRTEMTANSVRNHVAMLAESRLVETKRHGRSIICFANTGKLDAFVAALQKSFSGGAQIGEESDTSAANQTPKDVVYRSLRDRLRKVDLTTRFS